MIVLIVTVSRSTYYAHGTIFSRQLRYLIDYHRSSCYSYPQFRDESPEVERGYLSQSCTAGR